MPKRLAITVSGAVSLGSYEAGVLYEIIEALRQHNLDPATSDAEKIVIDVLTGASAGGMTATIAAQKLAFEASALSGAYNNSFYRPWVADVNLDGLLAMQPGENVTHSLLSSNFVHDIARRHITQRYQTHIDPVPDQHPAAKDFIRLGLALSNLNGLDYGLQLRPEGQFVYTRHQDELETWIEPKKPQVDDVIDFWEPLRKAAVSCGAFEFAFRVVDLQRDRKEYTDPSYASAHPNLVSQLLPVETFTFTDGGTFQNEPLGLAKDLVDKEDKHRDTDSRFYLFVAPGAKGSSANADFHEAKADFKETAMRVIGAIFQQARFHDWITAEKVNSQIDRYNAQAEALYKGIRDGKLDPAPLQAAAKVLLPALFANNPGETQGQAWQRIHDQFLPEYTELAKKSATVADGFIDSLLAFETAAQLGDKDEMKIYGITAANDELASGDLSAFAGFFERRLREHDYDIGREKARKFLTSPKLNAPGEIGPIRYSNPEPLRAHPNLGGLTMAGIDRHQRELFRDRIVDRSHEIMKEFGIDPPVIAGAVREAIADLFVKPQLEKLLKL